MATNIVNVGFSGTYPSPYADRTGFVSAMDNNDIFYYLGTNFGTASFSNPEGGPHLTVTRANFAGPGNDGTLFDNIHSGAANTTYVSEQSNNILTITCQFLTCKVRPTKAQVNTIRTANTPYTVFQLQASNDGASWTTLTDGSLPNQGDFSNANHDFPLVASNKYWSYVRFRLSDSSGNNTYRQYRELKLYGDLYRTDKGEASQRTPPTTLTSLPKYNPSDLKDGDYLFYDQGSLVNRRNKIYYTSRLTLSGTLNLHNDYYPNFYILNPNGAIRTINLPASPSFSQYFRIKTLNGSFALNIDDGGGVIATVDTLTPVVDLYWNGTEWTVINYG